MPTIRSSADLRNLSNRFLFLCDNFRFHNTFKAINFEFTSILQKYFSTSNPLGLLLHYYQTFWCVNKFFILS